MMAIAIDSMRSNGLVDIYVLHSVAPCQAFGGGANLRCSF